MKKSIKIFTVFAAICLLVPACSTKRLDIPQQGVQSEDNSYITDSDCMAAVTAVYHAWRASWSGCGYTIGPCYANMFWMLNLMADDMTSAATSESEFANSTVTAANNWVEANYNGLYSVIYYANIILDKFKPESDVKARCIAEAKFFRALSYYELITLWGAVPKVDHVLSPEEYNIGKTDISELWAFVEKDLNEAIDSGKLPSKSNIDDKETGTRITKEAALAVLGKVYLTEEKFTEAKTALDKGLANLQSAVSRIHGYHGNHAVLPKFVNHRFSYLHDKVYEEAISSHRQNAPVMKLPCKCKSTAALRLRLI